METKKLIMLKFPKEISEKRRNEEKCTNCTACVTVCPSEALFVDDRKRMTVSFDKEKCVDCELCIDACPFRAMEITL